MKVLGFDAGPAGRQRMLDNPHHNPFGDRKGPNYRPLFHHKAPYAFGQPPYARMGRVYSHWLFRNPLFRFLSRPFGRMRWVGSQVRNYYYRAMQFFSRVLIHSKMGKGPMLNHQLHLGDSRNSFPHSLKGDNSPKPWMNPYQVGVDFGQKEVSPNTTKA